MTDPGASRPADQPLGPAAVAARVADVVARIDTARRAAGRDDPVRLVAVSKTHPWDLLAAAADAGVTDLGENRVAELATKMDHPDPHARLAGVQWHFIGRLQSRKATDVVGRDALVHSVDRRSLVDRLQRLADARDVVQRILVQVNVADDPAKAGCSLREVGDLVAYACGHPNLEVVGLMTMPPLLDDPSHDGVDAVAAVRPFFATLRRVRDDLRRDLPGVVELSMGMSGDLEPAVAEGATMVRVGTSVFGPRRAGPWTGSQPQKGA